MGEIGNSLVCKEFFLPLLCGIVATLNILFETDLGAFIFVLWGFWFCFVFFWEGERWGVGPEGQRESRFHAQLGSIS